MTVLLTSGLIFSGYVLCCCRRPLHDVCAELRQLDVVWVRRSDCDRGWPTTGRELWGLRTLLQVIYSDDLCFWINSAFYPLWDGSWVLTLLRVLLVYVFGLPNNNKWRRWVSVHAGSLQVDSRPSQVSWPGLRVGGGRGYRGRSPTAVQAW